METLPDTDAGILHRLIRIPSVSGPVPRTAELERSARAVADELAAAGAESVRILEGHTVIGERRGPANAPTVLLYAHHDVQPPHDDAEWETPPFEPVVRNGRLYGRGAADDKAGIVAHLAAIRALGPDPPLTIRVLIDGEEETGSPRLPSVLAAHSDDLRADVAVIADLINAAPGRPALTTSLRGIADLAVTVKVADHPVHSGLYGGAIPDAMTALAKIIASLHDDEGAVAVDGLGTDRMPSGKTPGRLRAEDLHAEPGTVDGLRLIGSGPLEHRVWTRPAINVLGIDAPGLAETSHQIVPQATARISARLAPTDDPQAAAQNLERHVRAHAPWGAEVETRRLVSAAGFSCDVDGTAATLAHRSLEHAFGTPPVAVGVGGGLPVCDALRTRFPDAEILLTAVADPHSAVHAANESVDLTDLPRAAHAETLLLTSLARESG